MKTLQVFSLIAASIILSILAFALNYEDSLVVQYEHCFEKCKQTVANASQAELFTRFPQLKQARDCIDKSNYLKSRINSITGGPAPNVTQVQANELGKLRMEVKALRKEAKSLLEQLQFDQKPAKIIA